MKLTLKLVFALIIGMVVLFMGSCSKSPTTGPNVLVPMERDAVKAHLDENFIFANCYQLTHGKYLLPTRSWVTEKMIPYWSEYRNRNHLMYDVNTTSCEAFSFQCHFASQEIEKANVTVGVFFYVKQGVQGHAVNVILINENDKVIAVFFEPITSQFVNLSKSELESCKFWYF